MENKEKIKKIRKQTKERGRKFRKKNPDYYNLYYEKNKESIKERIRKLKNNEGEKEKRRGYNRKYKNNNREKIRKDAIKYKKQYDKDPVNQIKRKAQTQAQKILIIKGKVCEQCNLKLAVIRHHKDYNKPLEVIFLCRPCHYLIHKKDIN